MTTAQKMRCIVKWIAGSKVDERHALLINKATGCAIDCSCGDRVHRGRKSGRACKHMMAHNNAIRTQKQGIVKAVSVVSVQAPAAAVVEKKTASRQASDERLKVPLNGSRAFSIEKKSHKAA